MEKRELADLLMSMREGRGDWYAQKNAAKKAEKEGERRSM